MELEEFKEHQSVGGLKAEQIFHHCNWENEPSICGEYHNPDLLEKSLTNAKYACHLLNRLKKKNEIRRYVSSRASAKLSTAISIIVFAFLAGGYFNSEPNSIILFIMVLPLWVIAIFAFVWFPIQLLVQKYYEGVYHQEQFRKKYKNVKVFLGWDQLLYNRPQKSQIICYAFIFCLFLFFDLFTLKHIHLTHFCAIILLSFVYSLIFWNLANMLYKEYHTFVQKNKK